MHPSQQMHNIHHDHQRENSPPTNHRSKDIINTTNAMVEKMKRELNEKEHLIEEKNREILHLRMENEENSQLQQFNKRNGAQH